MYIFFVSILFTQLLLLIFLPYLRKNFLDIPIERSSHELPVPTSGGISFVISSTILCFISGNYIPLICSPIAIVGLLDDKYNIKKRYRFIFQFIISLFLISFYLIKPDLFGNQLFSLIGILAFTFLSLFSISVINFINFMDGIDGLLVSTMSVLITFSILINKNFDLLPILGSLIVFIWWNWRPAKVFMGDSGSTFLGAVLVGIIFSSNSLLNVLKILVASFPLLGDAGITVIRRFFNNENIFKAHKKQLFQRLVSGGLKQERVTMIYLLSTLSLCIIGYLFNIYFQILILFIIFVLGIYFEKFKAIKFSS